MSNEDRADLIALYEQLGRERIYIRSRQWLAAYYALLGNAALVAVRHEVLPADAHMWGWGLVGVAACLLGLLLNFFFQCQQDRERNQRKMLACHRHFSQTFRDVVGAPESDTSPPRTLYTIVGGSFFLTFLLLLSPPMTC